METINPKINIGGSFASSYERNLTNEDTEHEETFTPPTDEGLLLSLSTLIRPRSSDSPPTLVNRNLCLLEFAAFDDEDIIA